MKKIYRSIAMMAIATVAAAGALSCSSDQKQAPTASKPKTAKQASNLPNYRYVDLDTILSRYNLAKDYNEEMLRMQLKRFIIICTRIAREHFSVGADREKLFDTVRRYYVLVDEHFRTKKRVQDYAGLLHRSPKTLANLFASCGQPSPLNIIHDRVNAEARRLLLYTTKSAKEIAYLLGYEDTAAFSRFFAKMNGESITGFRQREKRE